MDQVKIGKFIQECRKAKNLTQVQLAQKIGVSEKTISKWECGNGFPDATLMLPLSKELGITTNELLSGKILSSDKEYKNLAETNLINLKQTQEKTSKFLLTLEWIIGIFSIIILLSFTFVASFVSMPDAWRIVLCVLGFVITFIGIHFCLIIEKDAGFYECACCQHKYIPTYKQILLSAHMGRTRHMKCPKCGKKSWNKKTIHND